MKPLIRECLPEIAPGAEDELRTPNDVFLNEALLDKKTLKKSLTLMPASSMFTGTHPILRGSPKNWCSRPPKMARKLKKTHG